MATSTAASERFWSRSDLGGEALGDERFVALGLRAREGDVGAGDLDGGAARAQVGLRLRELLVELGRVQLDEELALLDAIADVDVPLPHVAARAGPDRRLAQRLHAAREGERRGAGLLAGQGHLGAARALGALLGGGHGGGGARAAREPAGHEEAGEQGDPSDRARDEPPAAHVGGSGELDAIVVLLGLVREGLIEDRGARCSSPPGGAAGAGTRRRRIEYMIGTKKRVEKVATRRPPMTARPSGAFCSPPSPRPSDMGSMPMIIASAVIMTGPQAGDAGGERGLGRVAPLRALIVGEGDHQDRVGRGHADAHDRAHQRGHVERGAA